MPLVMIWLVNGKNEILDPFDTKTTNSGVPDQSFEIDCKLLKKFQKSKEIAKDKLIPNERAFMTSNIYMGGGTYYKDSSIQR